MRALAIRLLTSTVLLALPGGALRAQAQWTPRLSMDIQPVGEAVCSFDGRWAAWTQRSAVLDGENSRYLTQIWMARADGSSRRQLTRGDRSATSPAFSPDSRFVYFHSARSGQPNLWRIGVDGGEAEKLTDWKGELDSFLISPDGQRIAFTGAREPAGREQAKREKRDFRVLDENPLNHSLWVIPAEAGPDGKRAARQVFDAPYHVLAPSAYSRYIGGLDWSPDGRRIVFTHLPRPGVGGWKKADISEVEVESGQARVLAATNGAEFQPRYSPDGRYIAYLETSDPPLTLRDYRLVLYSRASGQTRPLAETFDRWPQLVGWWPDSTRLLLAEMKGARSVLYSMPVDGPPRAFYEPARGTIGGIPLSGVAARLTGAKVGLVMESPQEAPEAYVLDLGGGPPARVSRANLDLAKAPLGETRRMSWKARDGWEIEGMLTLPAGYQPGRRVPLVLNVHGGPAAAFTEGFIGGTGSFPEAAFNARGYATLRPNPRGSSGYGQKFRFGNRQDWGGGDFQDLMAGVDHVISLGIADVDRLAVTGWSYGGFMTAWTVTQTTRFKAAVMGAGISNLWSMAGVSDVPEFLPDWFGGPPWERFDLYRSRSPLSFVQAVKTPTLILHGEMDERVPVGQGYEFYHALKRLNVPARMVVYPRMPHGPTEPQFALDVMERTLNWVERWTR